MDVTTLLEPKIDLERLTEILDGLGHEGRFHTATTWSPAQKKAIFEAAKGYRPIDFDFLVPSGVPVLTEVVHDGHNTLPLFSYFQKRFARTEDPECPVVGYNHQAMQAFTGPGYFCAELGSGEHEGELALDHTKVPKEKVASWPKIRRNVGGLAGIVSGGMIDYLRGLSSHVSIGAAYKNGKHRNHWFVLVRRDPR
jgi:hypothetical protein